MRKREIESKIDHTFTKITPDIRDRLLAECGNQPERTEIMKTTKLRPNVWKRAAVIAAAFVLIAAVAVGAVVYGNGAVARIGLDVNPGIEIELGRNDKVRSVEAENEDGRVVLEGMDLSGTDIDVAVNAIIGSMLKNGYLNDKANSVLVSIDAEDDRKEDELRTRINELVKSAVSSDDFSGATISQSYEHTDELRSAAEQHGITEAKAALIERIIETRADYSFEQLAKLSINELALLSSKTEGVKSEGAPSEKNYIGRDAAKQKALAFVGIAESDITAYECEFDNDDGRMVYEVEFNVGNKEYDVEVDAVSGAMIERNVDTEDDLRDDDPSPQEAKLSAEEAKSKALAAAGVSADGIRDYECELEKENDVLKYDISFESGADEYEIEIDAESGDVLKNRKEAAD